MTCRLKFPYRFLLPSLFLLFSLPAFPQTPTTGTVTAATTESLSALSARITSGLADAENLKAADPESEQAATIAELLTQAVEQLKLRETFTSATNEHERAVREAPAAVERVKLELEKSDLETTAVEAGSTETLETVEQRVETARAELNGLEQHLEKTAAEQLRRTERMAVIPKELVQARQELVGAEIAAQPGSVSASENAETAQAHSLLARARVQAATAQIASLENEQARYSAREELLPLARQLIDERISTKQALVKSLEEGLARIRRLEAAASARKLSQATMQTETSHALVQTVAAENTSITEKLNLAALAEIHDEALDNLSAIRDDVERVSGRYDSLSTRFNSAGYSDTFGILLRRQRKELPNLRSHREALEVRTSAMADVNMKSVEVQDMLTELANVDRKAAEFAARPHSDLSTTATKHSIKDEIAGLLQARKDYLSKLRESYDKYFQTLIELNAAEEKLVLQTASFRDFIDERILWLPSSGPISFKSFYPAWQAFHALFQPSLWKSYATDFVAAGRSAPFSFVAGAILLMLLAGSHSRWKRDLKATVEKAARNRLVAFFPVLRSLIDAAFYVMLLPALVVAAGLPLANVYSVSIEVSSIGNGFIHGGIALFVFRLAQIIVRKNGIAQTFFVWPAPALAKLRRAFSTLIWIYFPSVILVRLWDFNGSETSMEAARIVLIIELLVAAGVAVWLLMPNSSVLKSTDVYRSSTFLYKLRYILLIAFAAIPAGLAIAAILGYGYTAIELSQRLNVSLWFGGAVLLLNETAFFWILVKRRKLAIEEAQKRREAAKNQQAAGETQAGADKIAVPAEPSLDISAISQQAGRLLRVLVLGVFILGLWGVWAGALPALNYLNSQPLWSVSRQVSQPAAEDGTVQTVQTLVPVTVADMLLVLLVITGVVVALRNIPGLLDITLYQRLQVQRGERYAFNTLMRYLVIIMAVVYIFYLLGLQWKQIQWLVAGVSVGLGFGLQEIFANFVSGLILLSERPVRVGDIVTVGEMTGKVSKIRIRATTVVNWDHKEHIIPNKELITKPVLNWTLNDMKTRLVINVDVPCGSDYEVARDILLKIARDNPQIMDDPAPAAALEKLEAGKAVFVLLAHLANMDDTMNVRHYIIANIDREFTAAGIDISVPRMDVYFDRRK